MDARVYDFLDWLEARMQEPSSYSGLAGLLGALHLSTDPGFVHSLSLLGVAVGGLLAFILKETKH